MPRPEVTVVVAVYNTMPYLTRCLESLVTQSIGRDKLEVVAVDDGSTDGSGAELERYAARYPGLFTVIHQANSGGPAEPSNRALDVATGRYVFFVGADDYLGPQALRRLVQMADRSGADVTLGRVVGVNGRYVDQQIFSQNADDVDLYDSALPWSLANTKLFRRALIDRYKLRFPTDMAMLSDQPFTLEALVRAERVAVVADYACYYAVRRLDFSNITFTPRRPDTLLGCVARLMDFVAELIPAGPRRDAVLLRHFRWEVAKLVGRDFVALDRAARERIQAEVRRLADDYLTPGLAERLFVAERVRIAYAQRATLDQLTDFLRTQQEEADPPLVSDGGRQFVAYPGFRDPRLGLPDEVFALSPAMAADWLARLDTVGLTWVGGSGGRLTVHAHSTRRELAYLPSGALRMAAGDAAAAVRVEADEAGTRVRGTFRFADFFDESTHLGAVRVVEASVTADGRTGTAGLRAPRGMGTRRVVHRRGARLYVVTLTANHHGRLVVAIAPVTPGRVVRRLLSRSRGGK
ncbi:glycosyltransferase family 2 protein [Pilimelia terevasa]|uniref:glycosyltransferase family 2 protein n=1 Tax=Pilimelia terevasa TaxID=53372 RepID=UPI00166BC259|nr:glycosyltransferase [Pilimelia terevasa]